MLHGARVCVASVRLFNVLSVVVWCRVGGWGQYYSFPPFVLPQRTANFAKQETRQPTTRRNAWKYFANLQTRLLTKSQHHAWMTIQIKGENESAREPSTVGSQIVLKCLYLARIGGFNIFRYLKRDKPVARLISYIHHK